MNEEERALTCRIRLCRSAAYLLSLLVVSLSLRRASSKTFSRSSSRDSRSVRRDLLLWFEASLCSAHWWVVEVGAKDE